MKIYRKGGEVLLAACDAELLGKQFSERGLRLNVSSFYDGVVVSGKELARNLRLATIANLVGEEAVSVAVKEGFIDGRCIIRVEGVPHAQMVLM